MATNIHAREILAMSCEEVWNLPMGVYNVTFDNGEVIKSTSRRCQFSRYCWAIHELHPHTPLLPRHHQGMRIMSRGIHLDILSECVMDCREHTIGATQEFMEDLWEIAYQLVTGRIFNDWSENLEEYVTSTCAMDYVQLINHPPIKMMNEALKAKEYVTEYDIDEHLKKLGDILYKDPAIIANPIVRGVISGIIRLSQVLQIIGPLGFRSDVDSKIYKPAILNSYADGMTTMRDALIESRDASKNIFYQKKPMRDSEWGNRVIQMMAAVYKDIHEGDCGSTDYVPITIATKNHLTDSLGAFYLNEGTGKIQPIRKGDFHLVGKTIKIRSAFTCKVADRYGFCSTCFGELSYSVPMDTNIGHTCCTMLIGPIGQYMLSFKHFAGTGTAMRLSLPQDSAKWLITNEEGDMVHLAPWLKGKKYHLTFSNKEVYDLLDTYYVEDFNQLRAERLSTLSALTFEMPTNHGVVPEHVSLGNGSAKPSFTLEFLRYLRDTTWDITDTGRYTVRMDDWDYSRPILTTPYVQFSPPQYMAQILAFIKGGDEQGGNTVDNVLRYDDMGAALMALNDLVGMRLRINIAHLQVVLQATKIVSAADNDYRTPMPKNSGQPRKFLELMANRSVSTAYAHQYQGAIAFSPNSFLGRLRPPSPFDHTLRVKA